MSELVLERYNFAETETEGFLWLKDGSYLHTLERPWVPGMPGGTSFESCVPNGTYELIPHTRPNGDRVVALRNHDLHVYYTAEERGDNLILCHSGNYVSDVVGCIAPGQVRTIYNNRRMVASSRPAMRRIMANRYDSITITSRCGTDD